LSGRNSHNKHADPFRATADNFAKTEIDGDKGSKPPALLSEKYEISKNSQSPEIPHKNPKLTMIKLDKTDVHKIDTNARITCKDGAFPKLHALSDPPNIAEKKSV